MATFRKIGDKWRVEVVRKGVRKSAYHATKAQAEHWARDTETLILSQKLTNKTLYNALDRYQTSVSVHHKGNRWERTRLAKFKRELADMPLAALTPDVISKWRDTRLKSVSTGTVRREMGLFRGVLVAAWREWGWVQSNPFEKVQRPPDGKPRARVISDREVAAFVAACRSPMQKRVAQAFQFALETGMRAGEICGIRSGHISKVYVELRDTKNGSARKVPLSVKARQLLPEDGFGLNGAQLDIHFRNVRDSLKVDYTFHATRHTAATRIGHSGKLSPYELCAMFGWRDTKMALRYINSDISSIADRL